MDIPTGCMQRIEEVTMIFSQSDEEIVRNH